MTVTITPIYAALLAFLFLFLSARVIAFRRKNLVSIGDSGSNDLAHRVRAQANCMEYVPIGLLLILMAELSGVPLWMIHIAGAMLLLGRILHAMAFSIKPMNFTWRVIGMSLTLFQIGLTAGLILVYALL